jgi:hypothetical protein
MYILQYHGTVNLVTPLDTIKIGFFGHISQLKNAMQRLAVLYRNEYWQIYDDEQSKRVIFRNYHSWNELGLTLQVF